MSASIDLDATAELHSRPRHAVALVHRSKRSSAHITLKLECRCRASLDRRLELDSTAEPEVLDLDGHGRRKIGDASCKDTENNEQKSVRREPTDRYCSSSTQFLPIK
ncbi:MUTSd domain-containing protein [Psidium guajava]|nr:MUTSd domain-containing protein [Psidium guajava]